MGTSWRSDRMSPWLTAFDTPKVSREEHGRTIVYVLSFFKIHDDTCIPDILTLYYVTMYRLYRHGITCYWILPIDCQGELSSTVHPMIVSEHITRKSESILLFVNSAFPHNLIRTLWFPISVA